MATGGWRIESYYARGMLEIRSTLHLAVRLCMRSIMVIDNSGAASEGAGLWRVALPLFMVLDVVVWLVLRRSDRFGLSWRLPMDATDAAFWTLSPLPASGSADIAIFIVIPLAVEAGVRMGVRGMVVPAAVLASTTVSVTIVDKPVQLFGVLWLAAAVLVGMAFFRYCTHLHERAETARQRNLAAERRRAYLAGQNQVAMGASSAVDVIEGLVPVLGRPEPGSALHRLAEGWKGQLSASTTQEAKYLQVALLEWERAHNAHPDLSGLVELRIDEGHGTTLLSAGQVARLRHALDGLRLRRTVTVRSESPAERLPGEELRLKVNGTAVVVPADGRAAPPPLDLAAVAIHLRRRPGRRLVATRRRLRPDLLRRPRGRGLRRRRDDRPPPNRHPGRQGSARLVPRRGRDDDPDARAQQGELADHRGRRSQSRLQRRRAPPRLHHRVLLGLHRLRLALAAIWRAGREHGDRGRPLSRPAGRRAKRDRSGRRRPVPVLRLPPLDLRRWVGSALSTRGRRESRTRRQCESPSQKAEGRSSVWCARPARTRSLNWNGSGPSSTPASAS